MKKLFIYTQRERERERIYKICITRIRLMTVKKSLIQSEKNILFEQFANQFIFNYKKYAIK